MGNYNPNYFEKKAGSLEEAILNAVNGVKTQIDEKVSYVEYKFKNEKDAMKANYFMMVYNVWDLKSMMITLVVVNSWLMLVKMI